MTFLKTSKISRLSKALAATCSLAFSSLSIADDQSSGQVYQAIINSYYSVNGFYNFSANQADKSQNALIQEAIDNIDTIFGNLDTLGSEAANSARDAWQTYKKVLQDNIDEVVDTGYPDLRLAGDMANTNIEFNAAMQNLYKALEAETEVAPKTQLARQAAVTMALMMTKYSARSTSTVSQVYAGGDAEITIDTLASQFEQTVNKLAGMSSDNADAAKLLDSAITKWDFIKNSYINYNENRVNFIVNLYSKKIISDLEEATQGS